MHSTVLHITKLDKVRFKRKNPRIAERKALWGALPINSPFRSSPPSIAVNKEGEFRVVKQELPVKSFDVNRLDSFFTSHKVERSISLVKQRLCLKGLKGNNFEASCAGDAKLRLEEVNRRRLGGNVEFLERLKFIVSAAHKLAYTLLFLGLGHGVVRLKDLDRSRKGG